MRRLVAIALVATLGGCNFAVKHPAITAALVGGGLALGTCELEGASQKGCAVITGAVGLGFGLIAAGAMWLSHEEVLEDPEAPVLPPRRRHEAPQPPPAPVVPPPAQPLPQPEPPEPSPSPSPDPSPSP